MLFNKSFVVCFIISIIIFEACGKNDYDREIEYCKLFRNLERILLANNSKGSANELLFSEANITDSYKHCIQHVKGHYYIQPVFQ